MTVGINVGEVGSNVTLGLSEGLTTGWFVGNSLGITEGE